MPLDVGTKVGRYEILSPLGAGGMGEVYLARDAKLDRNIALKILPAEVAAKQERMARFVREAKAAAALNHPNIAHIYEIGEAGESSTVGQGLNFIAMEFVEGVTLREEIHRENVDLGRLLRYLQQVAEGLAKAHAAGIVHRDLKPDNIMIARDGYAKILDFGLAKLIEPEGFHRAPGAKGDAGISELAATILSHDTLPGTVMGTVGYMSPEQALGKIDQIDHRSDVFAFGCILFEAVARRQAFEGKDTLDSLYNIVHGPTPQIKDFNPQAPNELQRIVRRCLAKDPEKRYQSIKEVAIELDELRQELKETSEVHSSGQQTGSGYRATIIAESGINKTISESGARSSQLEPAQRTSSSRIILNELKRHRTASILVLVSALIATGAAWFAWQRLAGVQPPHSAKQMKISRLVTGAGDIGSASISPDGKYVSYALYKEGRVSLRVKQVSTGSDREIVAPVEDATVSATVFSPDSELIYYNLFQSQRNPFGTLYQVPVIGGREPKKILDHLNGIISFAPDGKRFAFIRYYEKTGIRGLMVASLAGGEPRELAAPKNPDWFDGVPAWSPDGKVIVCVGATVTGGLHSTLVEVAAEGGLPRPITSHEWRGEVYRPTWLSDGSGLILNAKELLGSPMQIVHVSYPEGVVTRITNDLTEYGGSFGLTEDSSTIVTTITDTSTKIWLAADAEEGGARKLTNGRYDGQGGIGLTQNGQVVYVAKTGEQTDIWMTNADGTEPKQLTSNDEMESGVSVSPNGRYIVFVALAIGGVGNVWRMDADGGNLKQLTYAGRGDYRPFCSPDGQWVVFGSFRSENYRLWKVPIDGGDPVQITDVAVTGKMFLPDGKLIFGEYFDEQVTPPKWRAALIPFDGGPPVKVFDFPPRARARSGLMADERTLLYVERNGDVENVWTRAIAGGAPKQLTRFTSEYIFAYAPSRDGKRFAVARGANTADIVLIKDFR